MFSVSSRKPRAACGEQEMRRRHPVVISRGGGLRGGKKSDDEQRWPPFCYLAQKAFAPGSYYGIMKGNPGSFSFFTGWSSPF
jgi:hypothetical protein